MQKIITGLFLLVITFSAYSNEKVPAGLNDYVTNLVNEASITLNNSRLSQEAKISKARELMYNNLDFNWMARYTLGRNGVKTLSNEQIGEFTKIYSKYVTKAYTDLIKDYKGEKPKIVGVRALNSTDFMVAMNIISNKGQDPIKVEYLVREMKKDGKDIFKVSDIITEGVSLIGAQQDEFTNTLKNEGFDQLIQNLQSRS
ncbi:MAG: phospholipid-binding protein MlaC [Rickettsia endosymbiont of Ixodes persulcatus]|nr:phospholipid-binding protein MlaC [Rickettsia endosymbiont of Ixodes persulcatus]MCZ6903167.1 phospholipid-binding protein MlaC [Rickettsia endosymbiont of Ixodes persulcatus]MCZ6908405.1 phospholipid-binding protein MlaC [Rickettsia endosymbiont of Ixodes persulcatus]MCZ6909731.1 phospholipid-binding protein MlaC [Rickettsia endosymbiont of Ixodes persulcatus]MCZ6913510.1 phospholipid-binding protein MlaC [Rickettsia endosymbiont of Ixodes persulcatus]